MKLLSGEIFIENMRFHACHGVMPQEQATGGDFTVSVKACYPLAQAVETDNVEYTLNYAQVYEIVKNEMATPSKLIEHVAGRIGKKLFEKMPEIQKLTVKVVKNNPPMGADSDGAGVQLHWINNQKDL